MVAPKTTALESFSGGNAPLILKRKLKIYPAAILGKLKAGRLHPFAIEPPAKPAHRFAGRPTPRLDDEDRQRTLGIWHRSPTS